MPLVINFFLRQKLLIRALKFRQDYRINKIFLPFQPPARRGLRPGGKKDKKHHPSSREGVHSLRQQNSNAMEKTSIIDSSALFSVEA